MKIKVTMADGKEIRGTRGFRDMFDDGWTNTTLRNATIRTPEGTLLSQPKKVKITNRWIVMVESDSTDK